MNKTTMNGSSYWSRRTFLQIISAGIPTLRLMSRAENAADGAASDQSDQNDVFDSTKFTPIALDRYFNASSKQFGPREQAAALYGSSKNGLIRVPSGQQRLRGIPFLLGPNGVDEKALLVLRKQKGAFSEVVVEIPLQQKASFICMAAFCDWDEAETLLPNAGPEVMENVGQQLAHLVLAYEDNQEIVLPIRRRFEVTSPMGAAFVAAQPITPGPRKLTDPLPNGKGWGGLQMVVSIGEGILGICALENPHPERSIKTLRLHADADDSVVICGLTLFRGVQNPLRYERLRVYRITLPEGTESVQDWKIETDLGIVGRTYVLNQFDGEEWLGSLYGDSSPATPENRHLYVEITASPDATLKLRDTKHSRSFDFDLAK